MDIGELINNRVNQGVAFACYNIGIYYYDGQVVEQNYKKAVYWFELAAKKEYAKAKNSLGICYFYGQGVEQSYEKEKKIEEFCNQLNNTKC